MKAPTRLKTKFSISFTINIYKGEYLYMKYPWIDEYLINKRSVTKDLQPDWNWIRYHIGGKMFAAICLDQDNKPYYITLKLEPAEGDFLRSQYEDIIPGYYMNKIHWNSVKPDGEITDDLLKDLLDKSYNLVLKSFSGKKQREILGLSCCGTECDKCSFLGSLCKGCNASNGKVFHAPDGKACPIYACCVQKHKFADCSACDSLPCSVWKGTKDPNLSDQQFEENIRERICNLKRC